MNTKILWYVEPQTKGMRTLVTISNSQAVTSVYNCFRKREGKRTPVVRSLMVMIEDLARLGAGRKGSHQSPFGQDGASCDLMERVAHLIRGNQARLLLTPCLGDTVPHLCLGRLKFEAIRCNELISNLQGVMTQRICRIQIECCQDPTFVCEIGLFDMHMKSIITGR